MKIFTSKSSVYGDTSYPVWPEFNLLVRNNFDDSEFSKAQGLVELGIIEEKATDGISVDPYNTELIVRTLGTVDLTVKKFLDWKVKNREGKLFKTKGSQPVIEGRLWENVFFIPYAEIKAYGKRAVVVEQTMSNIWWVIIPPDDWVWPDTFSSETVVPGTRFFLALGYSDWAEYPDSYVIEDVEVIL